MTVTWESVQPGDVLWTGRGKPVKVRSIDHGANEAVVSIDNQPAVRRSRRQIERLRWSPVSGGTGGRSPT